MNVTVQFEAQLREAAGCDKTDISIDSGLVSELLERLSNQYSENLSSRLLNQDGQPQRSLLIFVNDQSIASREFAEAELKDGDVVSLYPPISGG